MKYNSKVLDPYYLKQVDQYLFNYYLKAPYKNTSKYIASSKGIFKFKELYITRHFAYVILESIGVTNTKNHYIAVVGSDWTNTVIQLCLGIQKYVNKFK